MTAAVFVSVTARRVCNAYRLRGWQRLPTRAAPACANGRAGRLSGGNASDRQTGTLDPGVACGTARVRLYIGSVTAYRLAMLTFSPVASAAHAAGIAAADVVPFAWVSDAVRDETRYRIALESATRAGYIDEVDAAERRDASAARVRIAVDVASDHVWADGVRAVVVLESGNHADAGTLHASGVAYVRPIETVGGGYVARGRDGAAVAFDCIGDAVAHAAGAARRVTLPGEALPPAAPSHGAAAPILPAFA